MKRKATKDMKLVEIADPVLVVVIRAEIPLTEGIADADRDVESALDTLRGSGAAEITERRIIGTYVGEAKQKL